MSFLATKNQNESGLSKLFKLGRLGMGHGFAPLRRARRRIGGYSGAELREIRAQRGVGRPPMPRDADALFRNGMGSMKFYPALVASILRKESPNLAEWSRKPRKVVR